MFLVSGLTGYKLCLHVFVHYMSNSLYIYIRVRVCVCVRWCLIRIGDLRQCFPGTTSLFFAHVALLCNTLGNQKTGCFCTRSFVQLSCFAKPPICPCCFNLCVVLVFYCGQMSALAFCCGGPRWEMFSPTLICQQKWLCCRIKKV